MTRKGSNQDKKTDYIKIEGKDTDTSSSKSGGSSGKKMEEDLEKQVMIEHEKQEPSETQRESSIKNINFSLYSKSTVTN